MKWRVLESYLLLLQIEFVMNFGGLQPLYRGVRKARVENSRPVRSALAESLCHAMDLACVLYAKRVLCLQRSAATTLLLRRHGICAELILGAQTVPFKSHAWVEVAGVVVNDRPYMREIYQVLEAGSHQEVSG